VAIQLKPVAIQIEPGVILVNAMLIELPPALAGGPDNKIPDRL